MMCPRTPASSSHSAKWRLRRKHASAAMRRVWKRYNSQLRCWLGLRCQLQSVLGVPQLSVRGREGPLPEHVPLRHWW
jgi:hypothetical protein